LDDPDGLLLAERQAAGRRRREEARGRHHFLVHVVAQQLGAAQEHSLELFGANAQLAPQVRQGRDDPVFQAGAG
jgi:hypothetical protein